MKQLLALILIPSFIFAQSPTRLQPNTAFTPKESGWFFVDAAETKVRLRLVEADSMEKTLKLTNENLEFYKQSLELQEKISIKYREAWIQSDEMLTKSMIRNERNKILYIGMGIILTIGAGLALGYAAKTL
jgi:hypothetical protein